MTGVGMGVLAAGALVYGPWRGVMRRSEARTGIR